MEKYEQDIKKRFDLFINIFISILKEKVKFPSAGARPIISHQCFVSKNDFRINCENFIKCFGNGIEWEGSAKKTKIVQKENGERKSEYIPNKSRAQQAAKTFIDSLNEVNKSFKKQSIDSIKQQINKWFNLDGHQSIHLLDSSFINNSGNYLLIYLFGSIMFFTCFNRTEKLIPIL